MTKARLLVGTALMVMAATPALAQLRATDYTNSVLIDMSQIDALAPQRLGGGSLGGGNGGLLPAPSSVPSSRLTGGLRPQPASAPAEAPISHLTAPKRAAAPVKPAAPKATASVEPKAKATPKASAPKSTAKAVATPAQEAAQAARTESVARTPAPSVAAPIPGMTLVGPDLTPPPAAKGNPPAPQQQQTAAIAPQARVEPSTPPAATKLEPPVAPAPTPPVVDLPKAPEAPTAAPPAAPAVAAPPAPQQQAAVQPRAATPPAAAVPDQSEVRFVSGDANLSDDGKVRLDRLSDAMKANSAARLQLMAYAVEDGSPSKARRLSLSRALAVRSYLINKGVQSARIDVRALGDNVPSGDPNRVDLKLLDR